MTFHIGNDFNFALPSSLAVLRRLKVSLTTGSDFEEFQELVHEGRPEQAPNRLFTPGWARPGAENAFWIIGRDETGRIMHTQAMRRIDLAQRPLSDYLQENFCEFIPDNLEIDRVRSSYRPGPSARRICGSVVFHADVWLGGDRGRYRGTGLSSLLGRYAFYSAMRAWNPDHVFGFMTNSVAQKGFAERQGYMHAEPGAMRFVMPESSVPIELFMVHMDREDLRFILDLPMAEVNSLAA